ncbi:anti-sigma factor family protein [Bryobacter aggregatus]|uniref:anti-sigma factor family protein n=1 Tax=Bryobacter aggregatus TaxID=360054 RepID=UPI0004E12330|nr:zf-HC2 domain-containing protein [Bryobacter aggregatus]
MPTCKDFLRELSDYLDSSIDAETRAELDQHAKECPNCWVVLDTTKKTLQIYKGCEPQAVPEALENKLLAALQRKMAEKKCSGH